MTRWWRDSVTARRHRTEHADEASGAVSPRARLLWLTMILYVLYLLMLARYFAVTAA